MQIEAGKYYRTRDGRKAGPAVKRHDGEYGLSVPWPEGDYFYSSDGKSCLGYRSDDLIAEWTDEPHETPHFTNMLAEMQDLAENYGYTISAVSTNDGPLVVDFTLTN